MYLSCVIQILLLQVGLTCYTPYTPTSTVSKSNLQVVSLLKKSLSSSKVDGHTDRVFAIANHPTNAHEFVSSGWDNTLQVWFRRVIYYTM